MILLGPQFVLPRSERESCGSLVSFGQQQSQVCENPTKKPSKSWKLRIYAEISTHLPLSHGAWWRNVTATIEFFKSTAISEPDTVSNVSPDSRIFHFHHFSFFFKPWISIDTKRANCLLRLFPPVGKRWSSPHHQFPSSFSDSHLWVSVWIIHYERKNGLEIDWNMPHKALKSNKRRKKRKKKLEEERKYISTWKGEKKETENESEQRVGRHISLSSLRNVFPTNQGWNLSLSSFFFQMISPYMAKLIK